MTTTTTSMVDYNHMHSQNVTIVPDMDDNSDADSLASALFRDDLNSLAQLIIPSSLLGVLMVDGDCSPTGYDGDLPPRELMVTFDNHETVEVKYDGLKHTIVSSHDANHPTVPNGRAVDSVTIVKDKRKKKRFLKQRETVSESSDHSPRRVIKLPSLGLSRLAEVKSTSRKSKWSSSASLMSYTWRSRRTPPPESENASLTKLEVAKNNFRMLDTDEEAKLQLVRKTGHNTTKTRDLGEVSSVKSGTLSSLLTFRKKQNNNDTKEDDVNVRDYASLDYHPPRSPVRRRRLLQGRHRNVAHNHPPLEEEESPLAKTVSSTSVTSSSSSPALPSIPVITHTTAADTDNLNNHHSSSSMAFFLPQWPAKLDEDNEIDKPINNSHVNNNTTANTNDQTSFFSSIKKEEERPSWSKSLWPQDERSPPRKQATTQEEDTHILRHVIVVQDPDEPVANKNDKSNHTTNVAPNARTATAKPPHNQRLKSTIPSSSKHRKNNSNTSDRLATVESFDSFYDGLAKQKKQEKEPNSLMQQYMVMQEHEFEAFQEDNNNSKLVRTTAKETTMSLDRNGKPPERKRPPSTSNNRFGFRSTGRFARRLPHQAIEPKAPVDSIEIPLLPKSGSTDENVACGTTTTTTTAWTPSMFLCAAGVPSAQQHNSHRHTSSNSVTSSLADDESIDEDDIDPRQLLQQPPPPSPTKRHHRQESSSSNNHNNIDMHQNEHEEPETTDQALALTRRSWFRRGLSSTRSRSMPRRGRSQPPMDTPLEKPFPIVREDYSMNDGSYHVLKIGGPR